MSMKQFLLVCLISCFFENYMCYKKDDTNFCFHETPDDEDCVDNEITEKDFTWSIDTSYNGQKAIPKTPSHVDIDINRALYVENIAQTTQALKIKFKCKICKNLFTRTMSSTTQYKKKQLPCPTGDEGLETIMINLNEKMVLAVFDPECTLYIQMNQNLLNRKHHIFMRNINTGRMPIELIKKDKESLGLGSYIISKQTNSLGQKSEEGNINAETRAQNVMFPYDALSRNSEMETCNINCKLGSQFVFKLGENTEFANRFKLSAKCEWMTILLNKEFEGDLAEISLRHGFAILPQQVRAFPMDFTTLDGFEVIAGRYLKEEGGKYKSYMTIANSHGRSIFSDELRQSSPELTITFSDDNCLVAPIGAEVKETFDNNNKKQWEYSNYEFNSYLNLGYIIQKNAQFKSIRYVRTDRSQTDLIAEKELYNLPAGLFIGENEIVKNVAQVEHEEAEGVTRATEAPIDTKASVATQAVEIYVMSKDDLRERDDRIEKKKEQDKEMEQIMKNMDGKYLYWGIPAGFGAGSFASFIICNIVLFAFKRTVFTFWFKAMYKRYGSDTTMGAGTTMGKTMGGETIGGSTTVGGGTTMGGTTAGETGSTTAA